MYIAGLVRLLMLICSKNARRGSTLKTSAERNVQPHGKRCSRSGSDPTSPHRPLVPQADWLPPPFTGRGRICPYSIHQSYRADFRYSDHRPPLYPHFCGSTAHQAALDGARREYHHPPGSGFTAGPSVCLLLLDGSQPLSIPSPL